MEGGGTEAGNERCWRKARAAPSRPAKDGEQRRAEEQ